MNACKFGLQAAYKTNATVKGIVKWLIALALLPANRIVEGLHLIKQEFAASLLEQSQEIQNEVASIQLLCRKLVWRGRPREIQCQR
jgi:hypothetical protein